MSEERCKLCNKPYDYHYRLFGRGCLENLYSLLKISKPPRFIKNKEMYLCNRIAWKNLKFFLNKEKKYLLAEKYIALKYLEKINFDFLNDIREKINQDIKRISFFSRTIVEMFSFKLNDVYELYNDTQKFQELIKKFENINLEKLDEKMAEETLKNFSFIFDVTKKSNPISYIGFYSMQYVFWQVVVIGGMLTNKKLSAMLLLNSLSIFGKKADDLVIEDDEITQLIIESEAFNNKINLLTEKYGQDKEEFIIDDDKKEDIIIRFGNGDLLYALHDATMFVKAKKDKENKWNFDIEINDIYDFTDFKNLKEYADSNDAILKDMFSTLLNNFGVVSSEYGVIKTFNVKIRFSTKEGDF